MARATASTFRGGCRDTHGPTPSTIAVRREQTVVCKEGNKKQYVGNTQGNTMNPKLISKLEALRTKVHTAKLDRGNQAARAECQACCDEVELLRSAVKDTQT